MLDCSTLADRHYRSSCR